MIHVELEDIVTHDEFVNRAAALAQAADEEGRVIVVTRNGRAAVALVSLPQLEEISGKRAHAGGTPILPPAPMNELPAEEPVTHADEQPLAEVTSEEEVPTPKSDLPPLPEGML